MNNPLIIGNIVLKNNLIMAPMAGITDFPFRTLVKEGGAGLVCTEMVSSKGLTYNDKKTKRLLNVFENEHPVSVQIFGSEPVTMAESAKIAVNNGADIVDINMGCPVPKITKTGAGARLIENEKLIVEIMESVVKSVNAPVTIKIRIGLRPDQNVAPRIVYLAEQSGIKMVVVHGRPASAGHAGSPDIEAVAAAVCSAKIPVVGNGGIIDELTAKNFLNKSGCAGLMIGRGAIGDPYLFGRIERFLKTGIIEAPPTWEERVEFLKRHAALSVDYYGEKPGLIILRKVAPYYLKDMHNASKIRQRFNKITAISELDSLMDGVWDSPYFNNSDAD